MPIYLYRLTPPRPTFLMSRGAAVVFGPVADPAGTYGIAILNVPSEAEARSICAHDPAVTAKLGFTFGIHEMPNAAIRNADA